VLARQESSNERAIFNQQSVMLNELQKEMAAKEQAEHNTE